MTPQRRARIARARPSWNIHLKRFPFAGTGAKAFRAISAHVPAVPSWRGLVKGPGRVRIDRARALLEWVRLPRPVASRTVGAHERASGRSAGVVARLGKRGGGSADNSGSDECGGREPAESGLLGRDRSEQRAHGTRPFHWLADTGAFVRR